MIKPIKTIVLVVSFVTCMLLVSCQQGYGPPLLTQCHSGDYLIGVHFIQNQQQLESAYERISHDNTFARGRTGFATAGPGNRVDMYVLPVRGQYDQERIYTIGHELLHNVCGKWHSDNAIFDE